MHLLPGNGREPFQELVNRRAAIEVLEQGTDSHARSPETPRATKLFRIAINGRATRPVHTLSLTLNMDTGRKITKQLEKLAARQEQALPCSIAVR